VFLRGRNCISKHCLAEIENMNEKEILLTKAAMIKETRFYKTDEISPRKCHLKLLVTHPKKQQEKEPLLRK
jgi:hypothetical protein